MKNILTNPVISPPPLISLILLIALVGFVSMDIYFPSLPAISKYFNATPGTTQLTVTLFLCGFGFSQLFYGPLSDYFGRRPVLLFGFSIYLAGSFFLLAAHSIATVIIARLIQGIGAGAGASLCRVLLRDNFTGNRMAQIASYLTIGIALATALAPALGGCIQQQIGFYGNFIFMILFGAVVSLLVLIYLPETNKTLKETSLNPAIILKSYINLLKNKIFVGNMLCAGLALSGLIAYAIMNPFLLQNNLGVSPINYGLITLVIAAGELVGTYINSLYVMKIGYKKMMYFGITLMLIAAIFLLGVSHLNIFNIISLVIPTFLVTMSIGIIIPNATAGAFSEIKHSIGVAGAIYGFFQISTTIAITFLITTISSQSQSDLGYIFLILGLASLGVYLASGNKRSQE